MNVIRIKRSKLLYPVFIFILSVTLILAWIFQEEVTYPRRKAFGPLRFLSSFSLGATGDDNFTCECPKRTTQTHQAFRLESIFRETDPYGDTNITETIDRRHPNIGSNLVNMETERCSLVPYFTRLSWDGVWQTTTPFMADDKTLVKWNLFSASCDRKNGFECDLVRVLALSTKFRPPVPYCYFWTDVNSDPKVVVATKLVYFGMGEWWYLKTLLTYMIVCEPPKPMMVSAVSISYEPCSDVTNYVQINKGEIKKAESVKQSLKLNIKSQSSEVGEYDVAACLIALYYYSEDLSVKLVEWLELLKAMKVSKVLTYVYDIHPNNMKVLAHYEKMGFVSITYFNNPSPYLNTPIVRRFWSQNDLEAYRQVARIHRSDCILRNRHQYNYIFHLDRDEVPSMKIHKYLPDLIKEVCSKYPKEHISVSLNWQNFYINVNPGESSKNLPPYLHMLKLNLYTKECQEYCYNRKTIHDTRDVILIGAHDAVKCYGGWCNVHYVEEETATTAHFRRVFEGDEKLLVEDNTLLKYKEDIIGTVNETLYILDLKH